MTALSDNQSRLLSVLSDAADRGMRCPTNEDLADTLGLRAISAPVYLMDELARRGLIRVERYQRERQVTITATGKATAPVRNPAPHWRDRPRDVPAPAAHVVRTQRPDTARDIMAAARREGRDPAEFLCDLVWLGWRRWQDDRVIQSGSTDGVI